MSEVQCPLCGRHSSIKFYDPSDFEADILIIQKRGLGRGRGFEVVSSTSIFDGGYPELLDLISDRVAVIYDLLYEDVDDEEDDEIVVDDDLDDEDDESLSALDKELRMAEEEEDEDINDLEEDIIE